MDLFEGGNSFLSINQYRVPNNLASLGRKTGFRGMSPQIKGNHGNAALFTHLIAQHLSFVAILNPHHTSRP